MLGLCLCVFGWKERKKNNNKNTFEIIIFFIACQVKWNCICFTCHLLYFNSWGVTSTTLTTGSIQEKCLLKRWVYCWCSSIVNRINNYNEDYQSTVMIKMRKATSLSTTVSKLHAIQYKWSEPAVSCSVLICDQNQECFNLELQVNNVSEFNMSYISNVLVFCWLWFFVAASLSLLLLLLLFLRFILIFDILSSC